MFPIFDKLGGKDAALDLIAQHRKGDMRGGTRPADLTLRRWRFFGMPRAIQNLLAEECEARGVEYCLSDMQWHNPAKRRKGKAA